MVDNSLRQLSRRRCSQHTATSRLWLLDLLQNRRGLWRLIGVWWGVACSEIVAGRLWPVPHWWPHCVLLLLLNLLLFQWHCSRVRLLWSTRLSWRLVTLKRGYQRLEQLALYLLVCCVRRRILSKVWRHHQRLLLLELLWSICLVVLRQCLLVYY